MQFLVLKTVLVAIDLENPAETAIRTAAELAAAAGASLHPACVVTSPGADADKAVQARSKARLTELLRNAGAHARDATLHVLAGDPPLAIRTLSDRIRADVVVLGQHRAGAASPRSFGGTALAIVTNAWSPCLVASAPLRLPVRDVLVPVDLSDTARGALRVALSWASALRGGVRQASGGAEATLTALHVQSAARATPSPFVEQELELIRRAGGSWAGVEVRGDTATDADVAHGIASYVARRRPDLLVMGTRGLGLDPVGRLGSVAASITQSIDVPVLLVPPAVWMANAGAAGAR